MYRFSQRRFYLLAFFFSVVIAAVIIYSETSSHRWLAGATVFIFMFWFADIGVKTGKQTALKTKRATDYYTNMLQIIILAELILPRLERADNSEQPVDPSDRQQVTSPEAVSTQAPVVPKPVNPLTKDHQ